jgi:hypothetical protein
MTGKANTLAANVRFRTAMERWRMFYMRHATSEEKGRICHLLLSSWRRRQPRGRFVQETTFDNHWRELDNNEMRSVLQKYLSRINHREAGHIPNLNEEQVEAFRRELDAEVLAEPDEPHLAVDPPRPRPLLFHESNFGTTGLLVPNTEVSHAAALGAARSMSPFVSQDSDSDMKPVRARSELEHAFAAIDKATAHAPSQPFPCSFHGLGHDAIGQ